MNEVKKASIAGIGFIFDPDAFARLDAYLAQLKSSYEGNPDGEEIVADIEARIAELILSEQEASRIVSLPLIETIVGQLGSAEAIGAATDDSVPRTPRIPRRLYRNPVSSKLGGVCSGLGTFFNVDGVWFRLTLFMPLLLVIILPFARGYMGQLFGMFILLYIILWFAVPMANTPRQRLEMTGEAISASSISGAMQSPDHRREQSRSVVADIVYVFGRICLILLKATAILIDVVLALVVIGLLIAFFAALFTPGHNLIDLDPMAIDYPGLSLWWSNSLLPAAGIRVIAVTAIAVVMIPIAYIVYLLGAFILSVRPGRRTSIVMGGLWIVAAVILTVTTLSYRAELKDGFDLTRSSRQVVVERIDRAIETMEAEQSNVVISGDTVRLRSQAHDGKEINITSTGIEITIPDEHIQIRITPDRALIEHVDETTQQVTEGDSDQ